MILDLKTEAAVGLKFEHVQGLRNIADDTLSLKGYCKSSLEVIKALEGEGTPAEGHFQNDWSLQPYRCRLDGFTESISALSKRISNAIDLVGADQA